MQVVNCGDDVTMWCLWESNPDPVVVWVKNSNNSVVGKGSNITLHGVSQSDHGLFQCIAVSGEVGYVVYIRMTVYTLIKIVQK